MDARTPAVLPVYPLAGRAPLPGGLTPIERPGGSPIGWTRMALPWGGLDHINVWMLPHGPQSDAQVTIVDCGLNTSQTHAHWNALIGARTIAQVACTHYHSDHMGAAGWLCARDQAPLAMTRGEWLMSQYVRLDAPDTPPAEVIARAWACGWTEAQVERLVARGWGQYGRMVAAPPAGYQRLRDGDALALGDRHWRVITGSGHCPEHASFHDETGGVLIAGDQILPRISTNVSLTITEPDEDPLSHWRTALKRFYALPADTLVLPAHGEPFTGLHHRLDRLIERIDQALESLAQWVQAEPRRVVDCFPALYRRAIEGMDLDLATGETLAHLRVLERQGLIVRSENQGVWWFSRA